MSSPFTPPAPPGEGIKWEELNGALLLVEPKQVQTGIQTAYGESDAVAADVAVLDGPKVGETYADTLVFPKILQSQLKAQVGQKVLGRLGQGVAKPGQSPPWVLSEATAQDQQVGIAWLSQQGLAQPAPAQQQQPVQQQQQPQGGQVPF